ncbi:hypothetical protein AT00_14680 [Pseudoalteromonas lipolytica SCSIO 04301]|uniref:NAD-binding protein n=1 Tax=Pseudoalteromonas lipolytica TaxID=570156 RepID=UPI00045333DC|nr:NAD-binding protein [Pseudoalteromonas lipolytica]EWH05795.1 hypothetical protein AT00_14680 [Pseudoalteromonas lipolytica SCSIO 04301]
MKPKKGPSTPLSITGIVMLACFVVITFALGVYGFSSVYVAKKNIAYPELTRWFDVFYSTIKLFSLISSPAEESLKHWAISGARLTAACSVFFSIAFATAYAAGSWFKSNILVRFYENHYVIFGLSDESTYLIDDLLNRKEKVVIVEKDHSNPLLIQYKKKKATVIMGDASEIAIQLKASIIKAKAMIAITGCDLTNLAILKTLVESPYKPKLHCHIGIDNVMSYKLFEPSAFYSIENIKKQSTGLLINIFNLSEKIAIDLVQSMDLGGNTDTSSTISEPVRVLISGFGEVGESVFRELLLLSHFCNYKKIEISILTSEDHDFFLTHHQVLEHCNGKGLDLWDIIFIGAEQELQNPSNFNHIIVCDEDENIALKSVLRLYDMCTLEQSKREDNTTTFHYYNALNHDIEHQQIKSFGAFNHILSFNQLLDSKSEILAQRSHNIYAKTELKLSGLTPEELSTQIEKHDRNTKDSTKWLHWVNQPLFKRRSNFTEKRHFPMKLLVLGGAIPSDVFKTSVVRKAESLDFLPYLNEFSDLNTEIIERWVVFIKEKTGLNNQQLTQRMHALARTEHARWNAFHIVNNWRYGEVKSEAMKTHDCLLNWADLEEKRPDTIKYDYKNIYHIAESLALMEQV